MSDNLDKELEQVSGSPEGEGTGEEEKPRGYMDYDEWVAAGKDPNQWRDLETWKQKGEEFLPFVQKERDELREQVSSLRKDVSTIIDQQKKLTEKQTQEAYEKAKREYEAKLEEVRNAKYQAMEDMDGSAFRKAEELEHQLQEKAPEPPKAEPESSPSAPATDPDFQQWHTENPWYKPQSSDPADKAMAVYAGDVSIQIQQKTGLQGKALYDKVTEAVKQEFPHKFENQKRYGSQSVEEGVPGKSKGKKGYQDLPGDAKSAIKRILDRNPNINKERLVKGYINEYFPEG